MTTADDKSSPHDESISSESDDPTSSTLNPRSFVKNSSSTRRRPGQHLDGLNEDVFFFFSK